MQTLLLLIHIVNEPQFAELDQFLVNFAFDSPLRELLLEKFH